MLLELKRKTGTGWLGFSRKPASLLIPAVCFLLVGIGATGAAELTGRQILDQAAERHEYPYEYEVQRMTLIDKGGYKDVRQTRRYVRQNEKSKTYKYLIVFNDPPGVRGVALLTWQNKTRDDDQWLYLPSMGRKMKRIAKGGKRNYFMGTDFTFEDMVSENRDKFKYVRRPDEKIDGVSHFVVEAYPKDKKIRKSSGYKFRRTWVRKDIFFVTRTDYFDRRGRYIKRQVSSELVKIKGNLWRAKRTVVDNKKENHKTIVEILERSLDAKAVPKKNFRQRFVTSGRHIR